MPVFSCAYIVGVLVNLISKNAPVRRYICPKTVSGLSGKFTDYLVAFGIASIKISVVGQYIVPLAIMSYMLWDSRRK